ncbi:Bicaudal D-related-like protein [Armadillidium nasatum]|uniref:Bicaudal D-related-like protein n=1 Tax=Armadillidium nasatum TaxID=96803 RepID=A0A5N5TE57_9CRUS|nr:Bicaudal D-related-like protein [Armadillidium nasatum]
MLEKQSREKEQLIRSSQRDLEDLRNTNLSLTDRLEAMSRNSSSPSMGHTSLMNEMDLSDQDASRPSLPEDLLELDEDIECDEPCLSPLSDAENLKQLRQEVIESTSQLRSLVEQMRHQRRNSLTSISTNSSDEFTVNNLKPGVLKETAQELKGLIRQLLRREAKGQCSACGRSAPEDKIQMEQEIHKALEALDKLNIELADKTEKLKNKTDEVDQLQQQIMLKDAQSKAVEEERDNLKYDLSNTHLAKDELIKKAWDMRDNAVARKNACEIELAKTRIDVMQVNSQLMEAIQQKVELSQQLEQWQVDMQQLLDDQMRRKLDRLENSGVFAAKALNGSDSDSSSSTKNSPKKTFKIFALLSHLRRSPATSSTATASGNPAGGNSNSA